ncbi:MAG: hypothetical protein IPK03_08810 [Bacteroidetes bacterium]|nr:hypothetical protein [Bacteroidota bacterium]
MGLINKIDNDCKRENGNKIIVLKDKKGGKSTFVLENLTKQLITEIDIENCVYKSKLLNLRCDFGIETNETIYFVELKGSDFHQGFKQLYETIIDMQHCFKGKQIKARLVLSTISKPEILKRDEYYRRLAKKISFIPKQNDHLIFNSNTIKEQYI